jgi:hypothetical protein
MPQKIKIPATQLARVRDLEDSLTRAANSGDLRKAKLALDDLKSILQKYHHESRLFENYLRLYEAALEHWDLALAKRGFRFVRENVGRKTRLYLEATVLLAITHLRERDLFAAQPYMAEVLQDEKTIGSENQRQLFRAEVIGRFDQEGAIAALAEAYPEIKDAADTHQKAVQLLRQGRDEDELLEEIGTETPQSVKDFILKVDEMSKKMLPDAERLLLPSPREVVRNKQAGRVVFEGVKRRLYSRICDRKSDVHITWLQKGLDAVLSGEYVTNAVFATLADLRIGFGAIAVGISALVMRQGINNFCARNQPKPFMSLRRLRA